jgi:hypothetical protein
MPAIQIKIMNGDGFPSVEASQLGSGLFGTVKAQSIASLVPRGGSRESNVETVRVAKAKAIRPRKPLNWPQNSMKSRQKLRCDRETSASLSFPLIVEWKESISVVFFFSFRRFRSSSRYSRYSNRLVGIRENFG